MSVSCQRRTSPTIPIVVLPQGTQPHVRWRRSCSSIQRHTPGTSGPAVNPVGKPPVRGSGCYVSRRQVASLDRRIFTGTNLSRRSIMLRIVLFGLLIPLGVAVLAAMELGTPPRSAVAVVQPLAETTVGISDSHGALPKADRLEISAASSETPPPPSLATQRIS